MSFIKRNSLPQKYNYYKGPNKELKKTSRLIFKLKNGLKDLENHNRSRIITRYKTQVQTNTQQTKRDPEYFKQTVKSVIFPSFQQTPITLENNQVKKGEKIQQHEKSKSRFSLQRLDNNISIIQNPQSMSLQQIQQKIDEILHKKMQLLEKKGNLKKQINQSEKLNETNINQQLQQLIFLIKTKKNEQNQTQNIIKKWEIIDNKINILEKILAEQSSELDILKRMYAIFNLKRTEYKSLCNKIKSTQYRTNLTDVIKNKISNPTPSLIQSMKKIPLASTHLKSFEAPKQNDYQKYRYQHAKFKIRKDHVPSTSYQMSYPFYKDVINFQYKAEQDTYIPNKTDYGKGSSYAKDYIQRKSTVENFKELDCYHDKFKNLKMKYVYKPELPSEKMCTTMAKLEQEYNKMQRQLPTIPNSCNMNLSMNTVSRMDYGLIQKEDKNKKIFKNIPKNRRLEIYKSRLKTMMSD